MDALHTAPRHVSHRHSGQAMIESVIVIILACFCFLAIFQYANLFATKAVLTHARVAAIPACGKRITPAYAGVDPAITAALSRNHVGDIWDLALKSSTRSPGTQLELARLPDYMDSENDPTASNILDYELWDTLSIVTDEQPNLDGTTPGRLQVTVKQYHPLLISLAPMAEGELRDAEQNKETLALEGFYVIESHYPLYLQDANWQ